MCFDLGVPPYIKEMEDQGLKVHRERAQILTRAIAHFRFLQVSISRSGVEIEFSEQSRGFCFDMLPRVRFWCDPMLQFIGCLGTPQQQIREVQLMNQTLMSRVQQYTNNSNLAQVIVLDISLMCPLWKLASFALLSHHSTSAFWTLNRWCQSSPGWTTNPSACAFEYF